MWLKIGQLPRYFRSIALSSNGWHASASFGLKPMDSLLVAASHYTVSSARKMFGLSLMRWLQNLRLRARTFGYHHFY